MVNLIRCAWACALVIAGGAVGIVEASRPAAGVATTAAAASSSRPATTRSKFSQRQEASLQMARLKTALDAFCVDTGRFPTTEEGLKALSEAPRDVKERWKGPYVTEGMTADPWGKAYQYRFPGRIHPSMFELFSAGPDGNEGTRDDVRAP